MCQCLQAAPSALHPLRSDRRLTVVSTKPMCGELKRENDYWYTEQHNVPNSCPLALFGLVGWPCRSGSARARPREGSTLSCVRARSTLNRSDGKSDNDAKRAPHHLKHATHLVTMVAMVSWHVKTTQSARTRENDAAIAWHEYKASHTLSLRNPSSRPKKPSFLNYA
jgi:hypothetical protein